MYENASIGTLVMTVKARDGDRGIPRKIVYELVTSKFFLLMGLMLLEILESIEL